ncbi:hypothetical protein, conserved [Leishmania donovani]|uniref:Uncharacterized protein n=1 Tax=Leishmania donovani TaxID=5661 RepID=E9BKN1_LEIDO|nr:hypothetical protein, conserved [Leishmania donovani]AYU80570.1 hypothetical protein LdCL_290013300 [Leishmania donovani]CBZ35809.1 hypothetical protein, conserved [Leishmania donovani]
MFSASSSPALPVTLGHGYAAAMRQTSTTSAVGHSLSRIVAVGATAVALGVSAVLGGSLLYVSLHRAESAASEAGTGPSWWSRVARRLRICSCDNEEEDDAFATGRGAENLFDEEKVKARQKLPRGKAKGAAHSHASTATITAGAGAAAATVSAALRKLAGSAPPVSDAKEALTMLANTEEIREREQYIKLVRALLQREAGIAYDDDDDSSTSSDSTDVSLNYHLATAMEGNARDELLMAFSAYGDFSDSAVYGSSIPDAGDENAADLQLSIMIKTLEYLDMSNEREKLRSRRIAMYREAGHATPVSSIDAAGSDRDGGELDEGGDVVVDPMHFQLAAHYAATHYGLTRPMDERDDDEGDGGDYPSAMERQAQRFQSMLLRPSKMNMPAEDRMNTDDSVLDRILGEGPAVRANPAMPGTARNGHAALLADRADMMEDGWEAEDDDEEAELMAYLQQADNAQHFYSREEMRRARRDPASDIRIVGMEDNAFDEDDAESEWEDEADDEDVAGTEEEDDAEADEEDDLAAAVPWSRRDKRDFERELFSRIRHLAKSFALTDAMAEREVSEEDARKRVAREQRRQQGIHSSAKAAVDPNPAAAADDLAEGTEEWEDEADWEDA